MSDRKDILTLYNPIPDEKSNGAATFKIYVAVKAHFSGSYDIVKYNAMLSSSHSAFAKRNDKFFFNKIAEKFTLRHNYMIFVHNFLENADKNVFDLLDQDAIDVYNRRNGNVKNAKYNYVEDCKNLFRYCDNYKLDFKELL